MDGSKSNNRVTMTDVYNLVDKKINRLEEKVDKEFDLLDRNHFQGIYKKLDRITWWFILALGGLAANLALLIIDKV